MKNIKYIALLVLFLFAIQMYSIIYVKYLYAWPLSGAGMMSDLSYFSLKHLVTLIITVILGMLFGLETFIRNITKTGKWTINLRRLIIIGIPLLFLSIEYFDFIILNNILGMGNQLLTTPGRESFFRLMLGYILISSFEKKEEI